MVKRKRAKTYTGFLSPKQLAKLNQHLLVQLGQNIAGRRTGKKFGVRFMHQDALDAFCEYSSGRIKPKADQWFGRLVHSYAVLVLAWPARNEPYQLVTVKVAWKYGGLINQQARSSADFRVYWGYVSKKWYSEREWWEATTPKVPPPKIRKVPLVRVRLFESTLTKRLRK